MILLLSQREKISVKKFEGCVGCAWLDKNSGPVRLRSADCGGYDKKKLLI